MSIRFSTLLALLLLVSCAQESGQTQAEPTSNAPDAVAAMMNTLTEEHLITQVPEGWTLIRDSKIANLHLSEYVPSDSGENWQEKLSIEAMQGDGLPDPIDFLAGLAFEQSEVCEEFVDSPVFSGYENGYETNVRLLECRINKRTKLPIVTMIKVIRADQSLYTVTRIWRLQEAAISGEPLTLAPEAIGQWSDVLRGTYACNPADEEHPC